MADELLGESNLHSFVFYESFYQGIEELSEDEQLMMYKAIVRYGLYNEEPDFTGIYKSYFIQLKTSISSAKKRYKTSCENGSKGGAPSGNENAAKGKTCRKCSHRKSCKLNGHCDAEFCDAFELSLPKTTQNNPIQPISTQNYLNDNYNDNVNDNINYNLNKNSHALDFEIGASLAFDKAI